MAVEMGSSDARRLPVPQRLSLLSMSSAFDQKSAVIEFLKHPSLEKLLVLDLDKMAESTGLEFKSTAESQTVDTEDLVQSPVAYNGFKELLYECLQASL